MRAVLPIHGRDHCPGGVDPIPCLGGELPSATIGYDLEYNFGGGYPNGFWGFTFTGFQSNDGSTFDLDGTAMRLVRSGQYVIMTAGWMQVNAAVLDFPSGSTRSIPGEAAGLWGIGAIGWNYAQQRWHRSVNHNTLDAFNAQAYFWEFSHTILVYPTGSAPHPLLPVAVLWDSLVASGGFTPTGKFQITATRLGMNPFS